MLGQGIQKEYLSRMVIFLLLFTWVIVVNYSILANNLIYPEQSYFYVINQQIHTLTDLFRVYIHPQMLNIYSVPFSRPSGNFLMYQILAPFLGWQNPQNWILVNFIFLALTGYLLLNIYQILFPRLKMGGYVAFSIYLMHPALMLSRFIAMHFEFAYVFFLTWSFYCFILFCQRNTFLQNKFNQLNLFISSLFLYTTAVTFKESAVMLGPVLISYLVIHASFKFNKQLLKIIIPLFLMSLLLGFYLTLQWPSEHSTFQHRSVFEAIKLLCQDIVGWNHYIEEHPGYSWCESKFPWITQLLIVTFILIAIWNSIRIFMNQTAESTYQKSVLFLISASLAFLILPAGWSMAFPWHLSLTLLCFSVLMGFSVDYLFLQKRSKSISGALILVILVAGYMGCYVNISHWQKSQLELTLNRNAILHPPTLKNKLNDDSILVVEDSLIGQEYKLGNSAYSTIQIGKLDYKALHQLQNSSFMKYESLYTGTLFHWAYMQPSFKEQVLSFNAENLSTVPTSILYTWLQHFDNIFCVGYDKEANWHDRTEIFKANLLKEKMVRSLNVTHYKSFPAMTLNGVVLYTKNLLLPIPELCQLECEQNQECKGTTYINKIENQKLILQCQYFSTPESLNPHVCEGCQSFVS